MALWSNIQAVVLAAGRSARFKTEQSKLSFSICGQEMVLYPTKLLQKLDIPITFTVGYQKEVVQGIIKNSGIEANYAEQLEQKGTGHALLCSRPFWYADHILVMHGDTPLVAQDILEDLINKHLANQATLSFVTAHNSDPELIGYGRIIRDNGGIKVQEHFDHQRDVRQQCCINAGIYLIKRSFLEASIHLIGPYPQSGEMNAHELIRIASAQGLKVETVQAPFDYIRGVKTLKELWTVEHIKRAELITYWMSQGVRFAAAQNVHLDHDVIIGPDTSIGSGVILLKGTRIGSHCVIDAFSYISNSVIQDYAAVLSHSVIYDSIVQQQAKIGPFAHLRKESTIGLSATIGNFVEVSASSVGPYSKAKHLAYLGNAQVGANVRIGAGTVTCSDDGFTKHTTVIGDGACIGGNSSLVAPLSIGREAFTVSGSTLTESVPDYTCGSARSPQVNKENYGYARRLPCLSERKGHQCISLQCAPVPVPEVI